MAMYFNAPSQELDITLNREFQFVNEADSFLELAMVTRQKIIEYFL